MNNCHGSTNNYLRRRLYLFALFLPILPGVSMGHTAPIMHCVPAALYPHTTVFIVHYQVTPLLQPVFLHTRPSLACRTPGPLVARCPLSLICCSLPKPPVSSSSCVFWRAIVGPRHSFVTRDWAHKSHGARRFPLCALPTVICGTHRPYADQRASLFFRAFIPPLSPGSTVPPYTYFCPNTCDASLGHVALHTQSMRTPPLRVCALHRDWRSTW